MISTSSFLKQCLILSFFWIAFYSCVPAFDKSSENVDIDLSNPEVQYLIDVQDKQLLDSLLFFMNDENSTKAYLSTRAFASFQENDALDSLISQLNHPNLKIRSMAAYSLGQLDNSDAQDALTAAFRNKDTLDINNSFNANILEAIGKIGTPKMLNALATITTYRKSDEQLLLGQARGIYRFAYRGETSPSATKRMVDFISDSGFPSEVRLLAAHYLARAKDIDLEPFQFQLVKHFTSDPDPFIRMAIAKALGKTQNNEIHSYLINQLDLEKDYRVLINIIKALESYPYIQSVDRILKIIGDKNPHVAQSAVSFLIRNGNSSDATFYKTLVNDSLSHKVNALLYEAVLKNLPHYYVNTRSKIKTEILEKVKDLDPYDGASYIRALGDEPNAYIELNKLIEDDNEAIVHTTAMEALYGILKSKHFIPTHKSRHLFKRKEIADIILNITKKGDLGLLAIIGDMIIDEQTKLADIISETSYLIEARNKLELPREKETYDKLQKAISILKGEEFQEKGLAYNHPIEWSVLEGITDTSQFVFKTSRGNISFSPFVKEAPGSVANFLNLSLSNFYDNKNFHRVVPNFVIQGGCPRGDGYGSLDYSIRAEFSPVYYNDEGYVGMASAGPHTEGTQFFITHSPTPHLDGRYTIFGKVNDGMDIVHQIQPGDKILDVIISK